MSTRLWDRAAALVPTDGGRRAPEIVALGPGLPTVETLFTFMRDAELRFQTLRLQIEERTVTGRGEERVLVDVAIRHPGHARVIRSSTEGGPRGAHELWISDGEIVRTHAAAHGLGTSRPVRPRPRGLDDGLPATARVYEPRTPLPASTLPDLFIHPGGFCQNTLATGACRIAGSETVAGREAIVLECDHPRSTQRVGDRPDFRIRVSVDRAEGVILRLVESMGGVVTRDAAVTAIELDGALEPGVFEFEFPAGTVFVY